MRFGKLGGVREGGGGDCVWHDNDILHINTRSFKIIVHFSIFHYIYIHYVMHMIRTLFYSKYYP